MQLCNRGRARANWSSRRQVLCKIRNFFGLFFAWGATAGSEMGNGYVKKLKKWSSKVTPPRDFWPRKFEYRRGNTILYFQEEAQKIPRQIIWIYNESRSSLFSTPCVAPHGCAYIFFGVMSIWWRDHTSRGNLLGKGQLSLPHSI